MNNSLTRATLLVSLLMLSGCELVVMDPSGDVASQQADLIVYSTIMMLIVILPVMAMTVFFAFHFRASNKNATYEPDWDHSISLEIVIWSVPMAIIICLAGLTWVATHRLNPYDPLTRIDETTPVTEDVEPLQVQVVALDWKWMFIYPEYKIATVNELASVVDRPIEFKLTSETVMNAFYIPAMSGMIYTMAGMETELNAVLNEPGSYDGFSANYSGAGFSHMRFKMHAFDQAGFDAWVDGVRSSDTALNRAQYLETATPSIDDPVRFFSSVEDGLWEAILNRCVDGESLCQNDMMMVDALGGGGLLGLHNREIYRGMCLADDSRALLALLKPAARDQWQLFAEY
ncbi:MAG: ubiquinol oxidase subunit II [Pseudomonadota bacterium]